MPEVSSSSNISERNEDVCYECISEAGFFFIICIACIPTA